MTYRALYPSHRSAPDRLPNWLLKACRQEKPQPPPPTYTAVDSSYAGVSRMATTVGSAAIGPAKPTARLVFGLPPAPVLDNPRLSVGFGGEQADRGRIALRDT